MEIKGEYLIDAPREKVWALINDPDVLAKCIPGCDDLQGTPEEGFSARVTTKIGPVKATFNGAVTLSNVNPPESYTISGEGKGGVAGFAKGGADVLLVDEGGAGQQTRLTYNVKAQVGGKLAQLGSRLIDSTAKKLAGEFFTNLVAQMEEPAPQENDADVSASQSPAGSGAAKRSTGRTVLLTGVAIVIVAALAAMMLGH
ncbi:SRPBCC family protein [Thalassospira mesophila]|uniref:SRPBCC family protein n=1 Tax=Thalassospira mesophila TaxID=1293891 RepID=UPI000A1EE3DE|nr:carbon monoxide dehydrogenase subunit G [Thalassospira mesophila]